MKKIIFFLTLTAFVFNLSIPSISAQTRAHDIAIDRTQSTDSVYVMLSTTGTNKYHGGKYGSINLVNHRNQVTGYKEWAAFISQSGTSAPTATILGNTLGGTITWAYTSTGTYTGTLSGAFLSGKTVGESKFIDVAASGDNTYSIQRGTDNTIVLKTYSDSGTTLANSMLSSIPIRFRVYN